MKNIEIVTTQNGWIVNFTSPYGCKITEQSQSYVFNSEKDLGVFIEETAKKHLSKINDPEPSNK